MTSNAVQQKILVLNSYTYERIFKRCMFDVSEENKKKTNYISFLSNFFQRFNVLRIFEFIFS